MAAGEGTSASRGATAAAPEGDPPLVYAFQFPFAEGWCDPVSGAARIAFTGTVAFRYKRPRDRPGGQRPRGRARRPGLAGHLPHDRLGRHRRRQPARGRRDARPLQGRRLGHRQRLRLRADPGRGPAGRRQLRLRRLLPPGRSVRVGLRSPSPLPERTHAHVHPRPRRRGTAGHRAGRLRGGLHGHRRQARLDDGQPVRGRRRRGAHLARLRDQHRARRRTAARPARSSRRRPRRRPARPAPR